VQKEAYDVANVLLIGLDETVAGEIAHAVSVEQHTVYIRTHSIGISDLFHAGIVFVGGSSQIRLSFLREVRYSFPDLPVVVVAETLETEEWLDALDAGATDYCCAPIGRRQIHRLMELVVPTDRDGLIISSPRRWTWHRPVAQNARRRGHASQI
jgi:DNA-binding NarL/FixJ family response regulator